MKGFIGGGAAGLTCREDALAENEFRWLEFTDPGSWYECFDGEIL